jgi:hypothetical protein
MSRWQAPGRHHLDHPYLRLDTGWRVHSAPRGRPSAAQANGLGPASSPPCGFQALKGRDKDHHPLGDNPRPSENAISPFQGLRPSRNGFLDPGRWPGLW